MQKEKTLLLRKALADAKQDDGSKAVIDRLQKGLRDAHRALADTHNTAVLAAARMPAQAKPVKIATVQKSSLQNVDPFRRFVARHAKEIEKAKEIENAKEYHRKIKKEIENAKEVEKANEVENAKEIENAKETEKANEIEMAHERSLPNVHNVAAMVEAMAVQHQPHNAANTVASSLTAAATRRRVSALSSINAS